ncbi:MAG: tryptophan synthase subunit alpha [Candidatus Omnitrophota bacterium]
MNRIDETFRRLKKEGKTAFIPYVTAGDPDIDTSKEIVRSLASSGADIIELGIPFSDPLADGPTIQRAVQRSLKNHCSVGKVFEMVKDLRREISVPIVFMTYYNIIFNYGVDRFVKDAKAKGADGVIAADLPMEESEELQKSAEKKDFCVIMLTAPTTPIPRFRKIAAKSRGFIYYVSLTGVTGERKELSSKLKEDVKKISGLSKKPVCVGFGISTPLQAKEIKSVSSGIIVGSAIIKIIEKNLDCGKTKMIQEIGAFARSMARVAHE